MGIICVVFVIRHTCVRVSLFLFVHIPYSTFLQSNHTLTKHPVVFANFVQKQFVHCCSPHSVRLLLLPSHFLIPCRARSTISDLDFTIFYTFWVSISLKIGLWSWLLNMVDSQTTKGFERWYGIWMLCMMEVLLSNFFFHCHFLHNFFIMLLGSLFLVFASPNR